MWHTSRGDRTLRGEEAALVCNAIDMMIEGLLVHVDEDFVEEGTVCESGIALYDAFSPAQRIGLLHDVATHLLTPTEQTLPLSAALEATIAAIFVDIRDQVAIEIDFPSVDSDPSQTRANDPSNHGEPTWRQGVLAAYKSLVQSDATKVAECEPPEHELPNATCRDIRVWEGLVESLADAILWDRDFEMADSFLDADPGVSQQRRRLLGISEDYFTRVAPDPRPDDVAELASRTRSILRRKPR